MPKVMEGIKVVEVALYGFVPSAGAVLSDWGAEVVKIEHPETGDPMRGLAAWGIEPGTGGVSHLWEIFNRGKKSVGIDLHDGDGRSLVHSLVQEADVFLTNFRGPARKKLQIDVEDIRRHNPQIIYARGTGYGPAGPDADKGGFDGISYWARSGASTAAMPPGAHRPIMMPGPAFGDIQAGMHLAGGIAAALFHRERTGEGSVVDVSLLGSGMWAMQAAIAGAYVTDKDELPRIDRLTVSNPLANVNYRTSDDRFIALSMLESDRYWPEFCRVLGQGSLADDPRFSTAASRCENAAACVELLDRLFAEHPLDFWEAVLSEQDGQWAVMRLTREALVDVQGKANGYVQEVDYGEGICLPMIAPPVQFDETTTKPAPAPRFGADTDDVLLASGFEWDDLLSLKLKGVIS
jgi:crotonobetainyl-CoA:carnitine CoA-transferase CaiB-like acyl-CoA transferase